MEYTKGEWVITELHGGERNIVALDKTGYPKEIICRDVRHYNMNLIASAPDMYEALEELYKIMMELDLTQSQIDSCIKASKALNKAEGK